MPYQDSRGLDWLIVIVIPESDFMEQINANTQTTILLCLLALAVATGLGVITSNWIAKPIRRLNQASEGNSVWRIRAKYSRLSRARTRCFSQIL